MSKRRHLARLRSRQLLEPRPERLIPFEVSREVREAFSELQEHPGTSGMNDVHFQHPRFTGGISCTSGEAMLLHDSARIVGSTRALEIGSYIGWSSAHLAKGLTGALDCVEPFLSAGKGSRESSKDEATAYFWSTMRRCGVADKIRLSSGESPAVLPEIAPQGGWGYVFVDGWHQDGQPLRDVRGLLPHTAPDCLLVLHDLWIPDVRDAAMFLMLQGFTIAVCATANFLTFATRAVDAPWWPGIIELTRDPQFLLEDSSMSLGRFGLGQASFDEFASAFIASS